MTQTRRENYKGRKLLVKKGRKWGTLDTFINGHVLGTTISRNPDKELASLRNWIDAADERFLTEPDAYPEHFYVGATT